MTPVHFDFQTSFAEVYKAQVESTVCNDKPFSDPPYIYPEICPVSLSPYLEIR